MKRATHKKNPTNEVFSEVSLFKCDADNKIGSCENTCIGCYHNG